MRNRTIALGPLWQTVRRHEIRPQTLQRLVGYWQQPTFGRLRLDIKLQKSTLLVADHRLTTGTTQFYAWENGEPEPSVTVELVSFRCTPKEFIYEYHHQVVLSLHSLARRFQRCSANDDTAILQDICACIDRRAVIMAGAEKDFEIDCPHGRWLGARRGIDFNDGREGCQSLAVRTFIEQEADALVPA